MASDGLIIRTGRTTSMASVTLDINTEGGA
jgi:hypothetical protein